MLVGFRVGEVTVVLGVESVVDDEEFVEFEIARTSNEVVDMDFKAERIPKYAGFRVTVSSKISPAPVPGNVEGIQEYYRDQIKSENRRKNVNLPCHQNPKL
jgi:tRNA(Ile2) C34 agmatinyltransferase TiaS